MNRSTFAMEHPSDLARDLISDQVARGEGESEQPSGGGRLADQGARREVILDDLGRDRPSPLVTVVQRHA